MRITRTLRLFGSATLIGALVLTSAPNAAADQVRDDQWALKSLEARAVSEISKGKGQTVAVIDNGVNSGHPDLKGSVLPGKDFIDGGSAAPKKGDDHGTGMSGIIAGHGHGPGNQNGVLGLASEAKILPIRANASSPQEFAEAVKWAVDHDATVINVSQGGGSNSSDATEAVSYALKQDVPVFASTGNSGGSVEYPAAYPGVVPVGGLQEDGRIWKGSNTGKKTLLSAPAVDVVTTGGPSNLNGYGTGDGTSAATAYASAAAALVRAKHPDLSAGQVVNRLTKTAEMPAAEKGAKVPDERYGYGAIRPLAALQEDVAKGPKYGPLSVPQELKDEEEAAEQKRKDEALEKKADQQFVILWTITGVLALLLVGVIVLIVVRVRRRKRNRDNGPGGPGAGGGYAYPGPAAPGYGAPPQGHGVPQQGTSPQQSPYN